MINTTRHNPMESGRISKCLFDGGYVALNSNGAPTAWNYYVTDHLGSTRAMIKGGNVVEEDDYYPYGGRRDIQSMDMLSTNRYRFSSKETQTVGAIGWLDFGARMYDPYLCHWTSPDPLAEKYRSLTPYG